MVKPSIAVDITARDKTDAGAKSAERRFGAFAKKTGGLSKESGLSKLGKGLENLSRFKSLNFDAPGRSLSSIGVMSGNVAGNFAAMTTSMLSFGGQATGVLGSVAEAAGTATGVLAGTAATVVGLGVAGYVLGDKWAKTGAEIGRTAKSLAVSSTFLQRARAENERFGVSADQTTGSLDGLASTLYDAKTGANNLALGALNQLGVKLKTNKDGVVDLEAAYYDLADAIARQKDPNVQRKLAAVFGLSGALPAIREGSSSLKAQGADFQASGAELSEAEVSKSTQVNRKTIALRQNLGVIEKTAGMKAMGLTDVAADKGADVLRHPGEALTALKDGAVDLARGGARAARSLVEGAEDAGRKLSGTFDAFVSRIEHQESRGRQLDRKGQPLMCAAGAVGAMQMLPETAKRAAKRAGIAWDEHRFRYDKAYNQALGRAELERLTEKFGGDQVLAAAAYNAGEGRLTGYRDRSGRRHKGWLEIYGDPRKGEISDADFAAKIPFKETRDYVRNTAALAPPVQLAAASAGTPAAAAAPSKAQVEIVLKGAGAGTVARVSGAPGVDVGLRVQRSLEDAG